MNYRYGYVHYRITPTVNTVGFEPIAYAPDSGELSVTLTIYRTGDGIGTATVDYASANGTVAAGTDYTAVSGTLTWDDGDTDDKTIVVTLLDGYGSGNFTVTLSSPDNCTIGSGDDVATITIVEVPSEGPTYTLYFNTQSGFGTNYATGTIEYEEMGTTSIEFLATSSETQSGTFEIGIQCVAATDMNSPTVGQTGQITIYDPTADTLDPDNDIAGGLFYWADVSGSPSFTVQIVSVNGDPISGGSSVVINHTL